MQKNKQGTSYFKFLLATLITVLIGVVSVAAITVAMLNLEGKEASEVYALLITLGLLVGIVSSSRNYYKFIKPVNLITRHIEKLAEQDLQYQTDEKNAGSLKTIAISLNELSNSWLSIIEDTNKLSQELHGTSINAQKAVEGLNKSAENTINIVNQASNSMNNLVQNSIESSTAIEEMASGISKVADSTSTIAENSQVTLKESIEGKKVVEMLKQQMDNISLSMKELNTSIKTLQSDSTEIGQIVSSIKEIAGQTNLLSLNASIEAARAGEHGRGFAVVANEVGKLAQETSQSAEQITLLVSKIQKQTENTVSSMDLSQQEVSEGAKVVDTTAKTFDKIAILIDKITGEIEEISAISEELAAGTEEVASGINEVSNNSKLLAEETKQVFTLMNQQKDKVKVLTDVGIKNGMAIEQINKQVSQFKIK